MKRLCILKVLFIIILAGCSTDYSVQSFDHVHGVGYGIEEPHNLFIATHNGLAKVDVDGNWTWTGNTSERHDLMGFAVQQNGNMIASGHPNRRSNLQNPLGLIVSTDQGVSWEPIALHGKVDFHLLEVNAGDSNIIYGIDGMGPEAGLYRSNDGGYEWVKIEQQGLPNDLNSIGSIVSAPGNPNLLLVGTAQGIYFTEDGGKSWTLKNDKLSISATNGIVGQSETIIAYLVGEQEGLMISEDFGESWKPLNLSFTQDAAVAIAAHPIDRDVFVVATFQNNIYLTADGGDTWVQIADSGKPVGN